MKQLKKLGCLLLALTMALGLATTALATEGGTEGGGTTETTKPGSITVDNAKAGKTYTAYKIFDVVYNTNKTAYSYTIDSSSEWFTTVQAYATEANGMTLEQVGTTTTYNVKTTNAYSSASFAAELSKATTGKTGTALTVSTDPTTQATTAKAENLDLGFYLVTTDTGALCNLVNANPSVTIRDKNDVPFDKEDDQESVEIGETVKYTITGKVPDTTGFTTYTYKITDSMSDGLTFNKDVKVKVDGTELTANYTVTYNTDNKGFELTIDVMKLQDKVGKAIVVEYTATVNANAVTKIENNKAKLEYSNDPTNSTKTTTTPEDKETVYTSKLVIDKYKTGDENTKLEGAKFVLYKLETPATGTNSIPEDLMNDHEVKPDPNDPDWNDETNGNDMIIAPFSGDGTGTEGGTDTGTQTPGTKKYYKYTAATETEKAKVEWVSDIKDATVVTTNDKGAAEFPGLKDGTYYLQETEAPAGYNQLKEDVTITINGKDATEKDLSKLTVTSQVANNTGTELPTTGGMGTTVFYIIGSVLALGALVILITKRRMSAR